MKKLITLLLAAIMIMTSAFCVSADSMGLFRGMNVLDDVMAHPAEEEVTRDEFAAVAATIMGHSNISAAETAFADVASDNPYGSAIRFVYESKIMNGVNSYEFAPDRTITVRDAMVAVIRILGFEPLAQAAGGYPGGYIQAATKLKAFNHITASQDAALTYEGK